MRITDLSDERAPAWDAFVASAPDATFYHQYRWRHAVRRAYGLRTWYLAAEDDGGRIRGILPLAEVPGMTGAGALVSLPYGNYGGIVAESAEAERELLAEAERRLRALGLRYLELKHHGWRCDSPLLADKLHYHSLELELDPDPDVVWRTRLNTKVRNQVRKAQKMGVTTVSGPEHLPAFLSIYRRNLRDLGTPTHSLRWYHLLAELFADDMSVVLALVDGQPAAGGWLFRFRDTAVLHSAAAVTRYLSHCPNNLLYWDAISLACRQGCRRLDFARSRTGQGTYHFKQQWGAVPRQTYYQYLLNTAASIPDMDPGNAKFAGSMAVWKRLPMPVANVFGPLLRKRITT